MHIKQQAVPFASLSLNSGAFSIKVKNKKKSLKLSLLFDLKFLPTEIRQKRKMRWTHIAQTQKLQGAFFFLTGILGILGL